MESTTSLPRSHAGGFQSGEHALVAERNPSDANSSSIVNRIPDGRKHWFESRLAGSVRRQVGTIRIRIAVHEYDIDALGNVCVPECRVREPVDARHLLGGEPDFLVKGAAQAVKRTTFQRATKALRIYNQTAVVSAHQALRPHMTGLAIHLYLGDLGNDRLPAEGVSDTATREDIPFTARSW